MNQCKTDAWASVLRVTIPLWDGQWPFTFIKIIGSYSSSSNFNYSNEHSAASGLCDKFILTKLQKSP